MSFEAIQWNTVETNADVSQKVTAHLSKDDGLKQALTGAKMVVIPAGIARKDLHSL